MSIENVTADTAAAKVRPGQLIAARVFKKLGYGALVTLGKSGIVSLLHVREFAGGSYGNRRARLAALNVDEEVAVEVVSIGPPQDGPDNRDQVRVSEKAIQEQLVREELKVEQRGTAGSTVTAVVRRRKEYGVIVEIVTGPAQGYNAMLHASHAPGGSRQERDAYIAALEEGEQIVAEVASIEEPQEAGQDLRISLTLTGASRRANPKVGEGPGQPRPDRVSKDPMQSHAHWQDPDTRAGTRPDRSRKGRRRSNFADGIALQEELESRRYR